MVDSTRTPGKRCILKRPLYHSGELLQVDELVSVEIHVVEIFTCLLEARCHAGKLEQQLIERKLFLAPPLFGCVKGLDQRSIYGVDMA